MPLQQFAERLETVSSSFTRRYMEMAPALAELLSENDLPTWVEYCEYIARSGWRTWESAEAFCRCSLVVLQRQGSQALWEWAEAGKTLARQSADVAAAFFRAARPWLQQLGREPFAVWVAGGQWYLDHCATAPSLAVEYFRLSPQLAARYPQAVYATWRDVGQDLAKAGVQHGRAFFDATRTSLEQMDEDTQDAPWDLVQRFAAVSPDLALQVLARYPDLVHRLGTTLVTSVADVTLMIHDHDEACAGTFLRVVGGTCGLLPASEHQRVLTWCEQIAAVTPVGVLDFLQQLPDLRRRLQGGRLAMWIDTGLEVAERNATAGQAYFALESAAAHERMQALQSQVTFADDQRVLQLYTEGLAGRKMELRTTEDLPSGLQMVGRELPTSDGTAIFVPSQVDEFAAARENFAAYKVAILHQLGFYECETFRFSFAESLRQVPLLYRVLDHIPETNGGATRTAFAQWFGAFAQPDLARQLFTILEDARIDAHVARRYKGMQAPLALLMRHSLQQRPALMELTLRQALLEGLLQFTLGGALDLALPPSLRLLVQRLTRRARAALEPEATVYTTVAAVTECYLLITQIPSEALLTLSADTLEHLEALAADLSDDADMMDLAELFQQAGEGADTMPMLPESQEPADGLDPVPYRGDMKPELIEKKLRLQELTEALEGLRDELSPIPPEILKEILERGDIDIKSLQGGDLDATSGLFVADLEGREGMLTDAATRQDALEREIETLDAELQEAFGELKTQDRAFLYDEWDYQIHDYRRRWCSLTETILDEDETDFIQETRQKYAELLTLIRRQFQLLKPEMFKKIKRLMDGEEVDLDSAVEAFVDRRAGNSMSEKVYMRRNKRDRDVAAVFLLDMSASTDDEVPETSDVAPAPQAQDAPEPRRFDFSGFIQEDYFAMPLKAKPKATKRRVIDVEKEALVLMAEALETLGDAYAIYGFSGYGRDQVDFFVAKEFTETYDARVQGRIAAMKPHRSTRMGPAIRHAIRKLERQDARIKTLLMLSDGYPQDFDYGKDRKSKDYGIQDTMMALREAQLQGIQTFCITVDPAGHDYLREMCPDQQYLIIDDISALPNELPKVYRGLTT